MKTKVYLLLLTIYIGIMSIYFFKNQYYNADMEAYMGLVYQTNMPAMSMEEIHHKVFEELKVQNPAVFAETGEKSDAIGAEDYYPIMSRNVQVYKEELGFFSVKPVYNLLNSAFFQLGFPASTSTFLTSILAYIVLIFSIFFYLSRRIANIELSFIITILISLFKPILDATRHATPDMLSCVLLLYAVFFFAEKKNLIWSAAFGVLTVLTRPEYFIFFTCLMILLVMMRKQLAIETWKLSSAYLAVAGAFLGIQSFSHIPWKVLFMNQFTKVQLYPVSHPDPFSYAEYFHFIKSKIFFEFNNSYFLILMLFTVMLLGKPLIQNRDQRTRNTALFIGIVCVSVFIRFLAFPILVNRMMIGFYLLIILALIAYIFPRKIINSI